MRKTTRNQSPRAQHDRGARSPAPIPAQRRSGSPGHPSDRRGGDRDGRVDEIEIGRGHARFPLGAHGVTRRPTNADVRRTHPRARWRRSRDPRCGIRAWVWAATIATPRPCLRAEVVADDRPEDGGRRRDPQGREETRERGAAAEPWSACFGSLRRRTRRPCRARSGRRCAVRRVCRPMW